MSMSLRARLKRLLPDTTYNWIMLNFHILYRLPIVAFESNLDAEGMEDIKRLLDSASRRHGDIIECGSSRCGTSILIARYLETLGVRKKIFALDSFEGFNPRELERERAKGLTSASEDAFTSTNFNYVTMKLKKMGFDDTIIPIRGFFEDTLLSVVRESEFSFALIDCDLQESMKYCAETLWGHTVPGGIIAFDDYDSDEFLGARIAVDEFVQSHPLEIANHGELNRLYFVEKAA